MRETKIVHEANKVTIITCDFCGKESKYRYAGIKPCIFCKRDVCPECAVWAELDCDLEYPSYSSDYPDYICRACWDKGEGIRRRIMKIRKTAEEDESKLIKEWENLQV